MRQVQVRIVAILGGLLWLVSIETSGAESGSDEKYQRDFNIFNPLNQYQPANPLNPINAYDPANPFNPINQYDPDNPANPINQFNPNNPFNPINRYRPENPLNPISEFNPTVPFAPLGGGGDGSGKGGAREWKASGGWLRWPTGAKRGCL
ncbi:hypothetical protein [Nitrospira defluvii]|uniref:Uncharacterized protein n=1 Tax=Nitrospira defluvii TaxID=330214 RepID=A0ABM8RRX4_9BACT|nr:hypothetical protein [Nitrospira defluvii]CAE6768249.1 conserved hypothetical protein [Nitrospira defluvii]